MGGFQVVHDGEINTRSRDDGGFQSSMGALNGLSRRNIFSSIPRFLLKKSNGNECHVLRH